MSGRVAVRGLIAIAAREASERAALLGLALLVAVAPFAAPFIPFGDRPFVGAFLGIVVTVAAAVLTGSSVIARDLAEGRLGFFLARPQPWWSIWGGKLLAAIVLTFAAGAIVLVPSALTGDWSLPPAEWWALIGIPGLLALIGGTHAAAVGYRSRSGWFAADLALAALLVWIVARTFRSLAEAGLYAWSIASVSVGVWLLAVAFTSASAAQVARGGIDIRRGHRIVSVVVWSALVPAVGAYAAWAAWVRHPRPSDLRAIQSADQAPAGPWLAVTGRPRWPRPESMLPTLLVDPGSGRFVRVSLSIPRGPAFSADGARAAWIEDQWSADPRLFVADLRAAAVGATSMPLPVPPGRVHGFGLSPDGTMAAVVQEAQVTVFPIGSQRPSVVAPLRTSGFSRHVAFSADGQAHVLTGPADWLAPGVLALAVLDPKSGRYRVTRQIPSRGNVLDDWASDASRLAVLDRADHRPSLSLYDATTGALLATPVAEGSSGHVSTAFLRDGRLAVVEGGADVRLRVFSRDGVEVLSLVVSPRFAAARAVEVRPGIVGVELPFQRSGPSGDTVLVDVDAGRIIRLERGLRPAQAGWLTRETAAATRPADLFVEDGGALVALDLDTGARQRLLPRD